MARAIPKKRRIGPLDVMEVAGDPAGPTVVLFHGYGADMNDLVSLASAIQAPKGTNFYFPNGHLSVPLGGHFEGRAWFPLRLAELEAAMQSGQPIDLGQVVPPGLKKARQNAFEFIKALGVPMNKVVIGGFSQGAMLATDVMLRLEEPPAGLALLSGTMMCEVEWKELVQKRKGYRFFQAHGAYDQVLQFSQAERLAKVFADAGWQGKLQRFSGAHEIPSEVLIQLGAYLRQVLT
ncbi:MAG: esterase [Bdellovibrionota bacterium]